MKSLADRTTSLLSRLKKELGQGTLVPLGECFNLMLSLSPKPRAVLKSTQAKKTGRSLGQRLEARLATRFVRESLLGEMSS